MPSADSTVDILVDFTGLATSLKIEGCLKIEQFIGDSPCKWIQLHFTGAKLKQPFTQRERARLSLTTNMT